MFMIYKKQKKKKKKKKKNTKQNQCITITNMLYSYTLLFGYLGRPGKVSIPRMLHLSFLHFSSVWDVGERVTFHKTEQINDRMMIIRNI